MHSWIGSACGACALLVTSDSCCLFLVAITNVTISFLPGESGELSASYFRLGAAGFLFRPDPPLLPQERAPVRSVHRSLKSKKRRIRERSRERSRCQDRLARGQEQLSRGQEQLPRGVGPAT